MPDLFAVRTRIPHMSKRKLRQVVVLTIEVAKLAVCAAVLCVGEGFGPVCTGFLRQSAQSAVPALLYLLQNNIIFFALSRIDAPTFQVLYQSKIALTALLSVLMLGRRLSARQWLALLLLTGAVVAVEQESRWEGRRGAG